MEISFQPVQVHASPDAEGLLAFVDGQLIAVLVRLSEQHGENAGQLFVEHGFGHCDTPVHPIFRDQGEVEQWIAGCCREAVRRVNA